MKNKLFLFLFLVIVASGLDITGQTIKISGILSDKENQMKINGGIIYLSPGNLVTTSDQTGAFTFNCLPGRKKITTRVIGYKSANLSFTALSDTVINIFVQSSPYELNEVVVTGDSIKTTEVTRVGNFIVKPSAMHEFPRIFSEPDLMKSFQMLPGVVAGKDGSSDIYVRGGGAGQNIVLANGCYFFLPGHLLGVVSPFDLDFLESAELYKDYFPADIGGGASSIISLDFKKPQSDSLRVQIRFGLLSSGISLEIPFNKTNWDLTAGLKRGNYSIYAPLLKKIVSSDVGDYLPPDKYSFYDAFVRLSHNSTKWGNISYLFFGNFDNGKEENLTTSQPNDTLFKYTDRISTGWNSMVHALQWDLKCKNALNWKLNLNYNRLSIGREIFSGTEQFLNGSDPIESENTLYSFSPTINNLSAEITVSKKYQNFNFSAGISNRFRHFLPNNFALKTLNDSQIKNEFSSESFNNETSGFFSSAIHLANKIDLNAGLRFSHVAVTGSNFNLLEPRLRLSFNEAGSISPHINYVRLSQTDHSVEGSNMGLRTMLWQPVSKDFGPEISDVYSAGLQGKVKNYITWTLDAYYKQIKGMVDFKSGASFVFDTSIVDILDKVRGRAYGLEAGIIKRTGKLTGILSYTYSRSQREWFSPEGLIWIPTGADRPHNINISIKYYFRKRTSFGVNWVYQSGAPATIYMHETSYGEWFEHKNNIRYFPYHRLDLSIRQIIYKRRISIFLDADIYNVYNHKNTFYFKKIWDEKEKVYYFKNISLFPIMPSLTLTIRY